MSYSGLDVQLIEDILTKIESCLPPLPDVLPESRFDRWLIASALQKSIRRGRVDDAQYYTAVLFGMDKAMLWRRLKVIALEDVGMGDCAAVARALVACGDGRWRRRVGPLRVALYVAGLLAGAVKSRAVTSLWMLAEDRLKGHSALSLGREDLSDVVLNPDEGLVDRAVAVWCLAGPRAYPSDHLVDVSGDIRWAAEAVSQLRVPPDFLQGCLMNVKAMRWSGPVLAPLAADVLLTPDCLPRAQEMPEAQWVEDMPTYACDGLYTRLGKRCVKQWRDSSPVLSSFTAAQLGYALFAVESGLLSLALTSPALEGLKRAGIQVMLESRGVSLARQDVLLRAVHDDLPDLNRVRVAALRG